MNLQTKLRFLDDSIAAVAMVVLGWLPMVRLQAQTRTADAVTNACNPQILQEDIVANPRQRLAAGKNALPPGVVGPTGFAWSDTQLGMLQSRDGVHYLSFGSDGSSHGNCGTPRERVGSITRTVGFPDSPLGNHAPFEAILPQSIPFQQNSVTYVGGGPLIRVPPGHPGAGIY